MGRGWFESDEEYRARITREDYESTIEQSTGLKPKQGWFESEDDYASRIKDEANEAIIENINGDPPSQGWFESDFDYRARITTEAHEAIIEQSRGREPKQGWFETDLDYQQRVRREAYVERITEATGKAPRRGWFESDRDFGDRVSVGAREATGSALLGEAKGGAGVADRGSDGLEILGLWGLIAAAFFFGWLFLPNFWTIVTKGHCGMAVNDPCKPSTIAHPDDNPVPPSGFVVDSVSYGRDLVNGAIVGESPVPPIAPANLTVRFQFHGSKPGQRGFCRLTDGPDMGPFAIPVGPSAYTVCQWKNVPAGNYTVGLVVNDAIVISKSIQLLTQEAQGGIRAAAINKECSYTPAVGASPIPSAPGWTKWYALPTGCGVRLYDAGGLGRDYRAECGMYSDEGYCISRVRFQALTRDVPESIFFGMAPANLNDRPVWRAPPTIFPRVENSVVASAEPSESTHSTHAEAAIHSQRAKWTPPGVQDAQDRSSSITCILPSGEETRLSSEACRQQAGVIFQ